MITPDKPELRLREGGAPILLLTPRHSYYPDKEVRLPKNAMGGQSILASEVRADAAAMSKNMTLLLRDGSGATTDLWAYEAITPELLVAGFASAQHDPQGWNAVVRFGVPPNITIANACSSSIGPPATSRSTRRASPSGVDLSIRRRERVLGQPLTIGRFSVKVDKGSVSLTAASSTPPTSR